MKQTVEHLIVPDRVELDKYVSLVRARFQLQSLPASRIQKLLSLHGPSIVSRKLATEDQVSDAPMTTVFLGAAVDLGIEYLVGGANCYCAYKISSAAFMQPICGFSAWETIERGRFSIMPSLMRHNSLEAQLEGGSIFVKLSSVQAALGQRPTSHAKLEKISREVIDQAIDNERPMTKAELVNCIRNHEEIHLVGNKRILDVAWALAPDDWKRSGPKRKRATG